MSVKDPYENPKDRLGITKAPLHLVPSASTIAEAMAFYIGGLKYGPFNWREKKVVCSIYKAAHDRHMELWWDGETFASDGVHHLGHAKACLGVLLDAEATGNLVDDRPAKGASNKLLRGYEAMIAVVSTQAKPKEDGTFDLSEVNWNEAQDAYYKAAS